MRTRSPLWTDSDLNLPIFSSGLSPLRRIFSNAKDGKVISSASMGEMAASAVLLGKGNSGDLVRIVTDITLALVEGSSMDQLDEVHFWRLLDEEKELNLVGIVALTKMFIVEWSNEFYYQMYHHLPVNLKFASMCLGILARNE
ncbi:unnamed protein product [Alternaria alternata]